MTKPPPFSRRLEYNPEKGCYFDQDGDAYQKIEDHLSARQQDEFAPSFNSPCNPDGSLNRESQQPVDCRKAFEHWHEDTFGLSVVGYWDEVTYDHPNIQDRWNAWADAWNARTPLVRESISFVDALAAAQKVVESYPLYRKFIDGTPLQNDIAVWMAEFLVKGGKP